MKAGQASRTAEYMALFRALESLRPARRRLFEDPLARRCLRPSLAMVERAAVLPGIGRLLTWFIDQRWPGVRTSAVARTRFIDDVVVDSMAESFGQVVILGAGFDARAYRLRALRDVAVFEVDHPDTFRLKKAVLGRALASIPGNVRFVPTDFNQRQLEQAMVEAGFQGAVRTLFIWEGVTNYLPEAAVDATLRWCAKAAPGSRLVFTYIHRAVLDDPRSFVGTEKLLATLAAAGEVWKFGIDPAKTAEFVAERGLTLEQDVGATEYRRRYYEDAALKMQGYEFYRIALVRVPTSGAE